MWKGGFLLLWGFIYYPLYSQTVSTVLEKLETHEVLYPKIVLAQSILETGWFKCEKCSLSKNNLFGLWNSRKKEYYSYESWEESIEGYKNLIQYRYDETLYESYYSFLEKINYAVDPNYITKLKQIVKTL